MDIHNPVHLLLIEDNENDAALIIRYLNKSEYQFIIKRVESADEMKSSLEEKIWDVVISDYSLPQFDAPTALSLLQNTGLDIPFIVVSGTIGEDTAVNMMKAGAQDYLMKDKLGRLIPAINREMAEARFRREHKRSEEALRDRETQFSAILNYSVDAIGVSLDGIHIFENPAYLALFGYSNQEELRQKPLLNLITPSEKERIQYFILNRSKDQRITKQYETRGLKKDGTEIDLDIRVTQYDLNQLTYTLVIIRDITERKKEQQELLIAKQKAEESNLMKSTMMMNMSHEVRTPMNAILGFSSLISNESEQEDIRRMAQRIRISGDRLMKTLDDILELAQLESGSEKIMITEVELGNELMAITNKQKSAVLLKNLTLDYHHAQGIGAKVDPALFAKVISEMIDNAIKFTETGGITVNLDYNIIDGKGFAVIKIKDTGIGITKENQAVIFESFRQVSGGYGRAYEGIGLGLAISKKIIDLLNGEIIVKSTPGLGSEFIIRIPGYQMDSSEEISIQPGKVIPLSGPEHRENDIRKAKILLVEDNEDNILVTREFCKGMFHLEAVTSGLKALEIVKNKQFDLILMDINLGSGMDGLETAHEIRKMTGYQTIPIAALTGYTLYDDKMRLLSNGCDHYLGKPFSKNELIELIDSILI